jgi:hypothetical protein
MNGVRWEGRWDWVGARKARDEGQRGLGETGDALLQRANREVPVDTGELRASGTVVKNGPNVQVAYTARHAVPVHERMVRHPGGRAKWLELAQIEYEGEFQNQLGRALQRYFG